MSIPMNFYTWWLLIALGCPLMVLCANIGLRGIGLTGIVLNANQRRLMVGVCSITAILFPIVFVSNNRIAIAYEFGNVNLLPLMYVSVGAVLLGIIFGTPQNKDVIIQNSSWILVSERKRIMLAGVGFIALSVMTFVFDLGV